MIEVLNSQGQKRFFPKGTDDIFSSAVTGLIGSFSTDLTDVTLTIPIASIPGTGNRHIPFWFVGWVTKLTWDSGGSTAFLRIDSITRDGTDDVLVMKFLRGDTSPTSITDGIWNIQYAPIIFDKSSLTAVSEFYQDDCQGWFIEDSTNQNEEFHTREITMRMTKELPDV